MELQLRQRLIIVHKLPQLLVMVYKTHLPHKHMAIIWQCIREVRRGLRRYSAKLLISKRHWDGQSFSEIGQQDLALI